MPLYGPSLLTIKERNDPDHGLVPVSVTPRSIRIREEMINGIYPYITDSETEGRILHLSDAEYFEVDPRDDGDRYTTLSYPRNILLQIALLKKKRLDNEGRLEMLDLMALQRLANMVR